MSVLHSFALANPFTENLMYVQLTDTLAVECSPAIAHNGFTTRYELITREVADHYLSLMAPNRNVLKKWQKKLEYEHAGKNFQTTHQGIAFNDKFELVDGQHRLRSISASGEAAWMLVTRGLSDEATQYIDRGKPRSLAHTLQIVGEELATTRAVAVARRMILGVNNQGDLLLTDSQIRDFMKKHEEALKFALRVCNKTVCNSSTLPALFARAYYHVDHNELERFAKAIIDQIPAGESRDGDKVARHLKSLADGTSKTTVEVASLYRKAQNALRYYLSNTNPTCLVEVKKDLFPLKD